MTRDHLLCALSVVLFCARAGAAVAPTPDDPVPPDRPEIAPLECTLSYLCWPGEGLDDFNPQWFAMCDSQGDAFRALCMADNAVLPSSEQIDCNVVYQETYDSCVLGNKNAYIAWVNRRCHCPEAPLADTRLEDAIATVDVEISGGTTTMPLDLAMENHKVYAVSVAIIENGQVTLTSHHGHRTFAQSVEIDEDTVFDVASMTKLVASLGYLRSVRDGEALPLDQAISSYGATGTMATWLFVKFIGAFATAPDFITPRRLLSHAAGLSRHGVGLSSAGGWALTVSNLLMGHSILDTHPTHGPGTALDYSGGGFTAAEAIYEEFGGQDSATQLNARLAEWGMTNSTFDRATFDMNAAHGCTGGRACTTIPPFSIAKFAGGMLASSAEYAELLTVIMAGGQNSAGVQLFTTDEMEEVMTPTWDIASSLDVCVTDAQCSGTESCYDGQCRDRLEWSDAKGYGLGVYLSPRSKKSPDGFPRCLSHSGAHTYASTRFWLNRDTGQGVVILVAGRHDYTRDGVTYGAEKLRKAIMSEYRDAFAASGTCAAN